MCLSTPVHYRRGRATGIRRTVYCRSLFRDAWLPADGQARPARLRDGVLVAPIAAPGRP
jgi:hypothetical protein